MGGAAPGARGAPGRRVGTLRRLERRRRRHRPVAGADARDRGRHLVPGRRGRAGCAQRRGQGGVRRARPVVPARPVVVRDLLDRRQRRDQRRRPVLRQVRRHHRLRARARRGAGGRHPRHPRRQADQGRGRAVVAQALRGLRGDPRHRHPGDPAAGPRAAAGGHAGRVLRRRAPRGRGRRGGAEPAASLDDGADGQCVGQRRRGLLTDGARPQRRRPAAGAVGRAGSRAG